MNISVIVPVFNEGKNLSILHEQICSVFRNLNEEFEIIFVDDGSTDDSFGILKEIALKDKRVKPIKFAQNYGQTSALDAGLRRAKGDFILTIDADLQYDPKDLIRIFEELKNNDVVICHRINRRNSDGCIKDLSSKIANYIRSMVLKEDFTDVGFLKGFRRECLEGLFLYDGFEVFVASLMNIAGWRIKKIDVELSSRKYGKSKYNIRNRFFKRAVALMIVKWMKDNRLKYKITYLK